MDYLNHRLGIKKVLKALLGSMLILAIVVFIIQGLLVLIPVGIGLWAIYKGIKFIKAKFLGLKRDKVNKVGPIDICNDKFQSMNSSNVIDVEYEQVNK